MSKLSEEGLRESFGPKYREALEQWREVLEPIVRKRPGISLWDLAKQIHKTPTITAYAVANVAVLERRGDGIYLRAEPLAE